MTLVPLDFAKKGHLCHHTPLVLRSDREHAPTLLDPLAALLIANRCDRPLFAGIAAAQQTIPGDLQDAFEYLSVEQYGDGSYVPANPLASGLQTTGQVAQSLVVVPAGAPTALPQPVLILHPAAYNC